MHFKPVYKLCDWVDKNKLFIRELSHNPKSIDYLKQNPKAGRKEISGNIDGITEDGVKYNLKRL